MNRRLVLVTVGVALLLVGLLVLVPRAEPAEATLALRRFLTESGLTVTDAPSPPPPGGAFVLLSDLRAERDARALLEWAADGGRLIVADPASSIVSLSRSRPSAPVGLIGAETLEPRCVAEEVLGVSEVVTRPSDSTLAPSDAFVSCFPAERGALLLVREHGEGTVALLGGYTAFTNEHLRSSDNALLALRLVGSGPVVFGPAVPPSEAGPSGGMWTVLPTRAKVVLVAIGLAAIAFALVRGRRLGRPVPEEPVVPIPASELVRATGRLYRRGRRPGYAGRLMRDATRSRIGRWLGVRPDAAELPAVVSRMTGEPPGPAEEALAGREPTSDDDLIRLGTVLEDLESRVRGAMR